MRAVILYMRRTDPDSQAVDSMISKVAGSLHEIIELPSSVFRLPSSVFHLPSSIFTSLHLYISLHSIKQFELIKQIIENYLFIKKNCFKLRAQLKYYFIKKLL